jgi:hypothetical protein
VRLLEYICASEIKEIRRRKHSLRKRFWEKEANSCKYEGMIDMTRKCNEFIDTYGVIAMLSIQL